MYFVNGELVINEAEILDIFKSALTKLYKNDEFLIQNDVHEQTIANRFAMYLREDLLLAEDNGLRIDVEYNRDGVGRDIKQNKSQIKIRPDIILHERGSKEKNYKNDIIYCEIKKDLQSNQTDIIKIKEQMRQRKYKFGIYIYLIKIDEAQFNIYTVRDEEIITRSYKFDHQTRKLEELNNG